MGTDAFGGAWFLAREFVVLVFGHVDRLCSWTIDCGVNIRPVGEEMDISSTGVRCRDMWVALRNDIQDHADNYFRVSRHPHDASVRVSIVCLYARGVSDRDSELGSRIHVRCR